MNAEAQKRLDEVLNAPPTGRSRHAQTIDLARRHDTPDVITKAAVAQVEAVDDEIGTFEALVSDFGPDRTHERFDRHAFDNAIAKIRADGRNTPVLFGHTQTDANSVLGAVPPDGWRIAADGLHATGWLDVMDSVGSKIHRMLKAGNLQWSIGFSLVSGRKRREDGIVVLQEVDELLELSAVPVPANSRTRTLGVKADRVPTHAELLEREAALGLSRALGRLERDRHMLVPTMDELAQREAALGDLPFVERLLSRRAPDVDGALANLRDATRREMQRALGDGKAYPRRPRDEQRARARKVAAELELERALSDNPRGRGR
jgi:HK97 family phage prohead protease